MLIGVVSDTHNNLKNIKRIIEIFNHHKVSSVIHTGDIVNAKSLESFSKLNCQLFGVYGNNDRYETDLRDITERYNFCFQEPPKFIKLSNKNIAIFHEPDDIESYLPHNGNIDIVLHGHTHRYRNEMKDGVFFNPGESAGMQRGSNAVGIVDLNNLMAKRIFF